MSYENFIKRMNAGGINYRKEQIENAVEYLKSTFKDDPSYVESGTPVWGTDKVIYPRITDYEFRTTQPFQATIQTMIDDPIKSGDIILWKENTYNPELNNGYWLCVDSYNYHNVNWHGTLQFCNYFLKFLSPFDRSVLEYPIVTFNATQYNIGEKRREIMTVGSASQIIYLPYDEHTSSIDVGMRFLMDRNSNKAKAYRTTQIDTVNFTNKSYQDGLVRLFITEDNFNIKRDNKDLMIADYYDDPEGTGEEIKDNPDMWI